MRPRPRVRVRLDPHTKDRPEPIEILARMAGRSNFLTPKTTARATNTIPVTPLDIAHAIGVVSSGCAFPDRERTPNPLGASMAMAMACQRQAEWPRIELHGRPRLLHHLRSQRQHTGLVEGPNTYRARIGLFDAFHDLVLPAQRRHLGEAAKHAHMRKDLYRYLLNESIAFLEAAANTAAADAVRYLFSLAVIEHPLTSRVRAVSVNDRGEIRVWTSATAAEVESETDALTAIDISLLCQDVLLDRARRPGILALSAVNER